MAEYQTETVIPRIERLAVIIEREAMSQLILTNLTSGKHKFSLEYRAGESDTQCFVVCKCGYIKEIINFRNYGGVKEVQRVWDSHVS